MDVMKGIIDHRILLNYRIDPSALKGVLPAPLRPKLIGGWGIGGAAPSIQFTLSMRRRAAAARCYAYTGTVEVL